LFIFLGVLAGNWNDTSTGIDLDKLSHFPLTKIRSGWLKDGARVTFDGITAINESPNRREIRLRGVGTSGKRRDARLSGLDEVWRGDLDGNGTQDYVFFSAGPYFNGRMTPLFSLSILLMDHDKLPVPFFTVVWKGENGDGIRHLVDLDQDGHAELLIGTYDELQSDPRAGRFCSGHWVTQLYAFKDLGVEEIRGAYGHVTFPLVHNWTYGTECDVTEKPAPLSPPPLFEHGTSTHGEAISRILRSADQAGVVAIDPIAGCTDVNPAMVVYDTPQIREIGFPSQFSTYIADLTETIRRDGAQVELRGLQKETSGGECGANLLWATNKPKQQQKAATPSRGGRGSSLQELYLTTSSDCGGTR